MNNNVNEIKESLRELLLSELKAKGISQSELANRLGIDRRPLSGYLNNNFDKTSINKLVEMLNAIGIKVSFTQKKS